MKDKIRVLHIIKSLGRGGAETLLPETLKLHDKSQFEFFYIYFLPWKDQLVEEIENAQGKVHCFRASNNLQLLQQHKKIIDFCEENQIDVIHCHLPWAGFVGRLVHYQIRIPVVYSEHNMQERYHVLTKYINKHSFNFQNLAIGVSDDVTQSIKRNIQPKIKVRTVLNGVNTEDFRRSYSQGESIRKELNIPDDAIVIGNVAVFRFQKRLKEWLEAFSEIRKANKKVYGVLVGAGPLESEIKETLKSLDLEGIVHLPGLQARVKPYMSSFDIFMMSSSFEGLPIALLEAMSMECAVVSTNAGGIKEVIRDEKDGLLCDVSEYEKLPQLCEKLIKNHPLLEKMKRSARERVVNNFSLKRMVEELESLYNNYATKI